MITFAPNFNIIMSAGAKIKSYILFTKFRLSALVIISALSGYLFANGNDGNEIFLLLEVLNENHSFLNYEILQVF